MEIGRRGEISHLRDRPELNEVFLSLLIAIIYYKFVVLEIGWRSVSGTDTLYKRRQEEN